MMKVNTNENKAQVIFKYNVRDKVYIIYNKNSFMIPRKLSVPWEVAYIILAVYNNSTYKLNQNEMKEILSISCLRSYFERKNNIFMANDSKESIKLSNENKKKVKFDLGKNETISYSNKEQW